MSLRSLMMQTQQESYEDKISQKRRTLQDKFSVPLLFLNTSAIHLVQEHSSNFPEQKLLRVGKINTDRTLPCGLKGGTRDEWQEGERLEMPSR